jgi:hypothetical protein
MMKKYNFQSFDEIPDDLVEYVETVSKTRITDLTLAEINEFLTEVDKFLETTIWPWQDSGIESGFI